MSTRVVSCLAVLAASSHIVSPALASVMCQKRSGVVVVRDACKKKEKLLDLAQFGAVGPKGDKGDKGDPGVGPLATCPPDSVLVGAICMDKYEASVWQIPPSDTALVQKVQQGTATFGDLTGGGATQLSPAFTGMPPYPSNFPNNGQWTAVAGSAPPSPGVYAVSIPGVSPSTRITWLQATQACALSGKRLATNREWQDAVTGTPDGAPCVVSAVDPVNTGANPGCVSHWGAFDMVGNVYEWVADWVPYPQSCPGWSSFSDDSMCVSGPIATVNGPAALGRGGRWDAGTSAGPLSIEVNVTTDKYDGLGFRCAR